MTERSVTLVNEKGLHARAAARFVDLANRFRCSVEIRLGTMAVDGKSILGILTLGAPRGTELLLVADGPDESEAVEALASLIAARFGEGR
ncbi:MAG: HPr family phosphocarrier protein [Acidobacteriota bacterium]|nr:HPr family phosphocarrier protein [Acidobacteriota bacterium]MDQ7086746.1 HPr family phosphocarrier protein [Acidobacteriota bacterium]